MTTVFFSYSHKDEAFRDRLETHLATLKRQGLIDTWHDRRIVAGDEFNGRISDELERADIILLLVSSDFLHSDYCYDIEMGRALERHAEGSARVIPVILRPCDWKSAPFGRLRAAPLDGKAISTFPDVDEAYLNVVTDIRGALPDGKPAAGARAAPTAAPSAAPAVSLPRSSNLGLKKNFTEADIDRFREDAFSFMTRFFEGSLEELKKRNGGIETAFRPIDANRFTARVYVGGKTTAVCQVMLGGGFGNVISYSGSEHGNGANEMLSVEADDQGLYLKGMGMPMGSSKVGHLSIEGASEYYWGLFIERLQR